MVVPIYPTQALDQIAYILGHSGARLLFVDSPATAARIRDSGAVALQSVLFESAGSDGLAAFEARGGEIRSARPDLPSAYEATLVPDDLAVLIYTSGTTGSPKGVMLSHDNLGFNAQVSFECGWEGIEAGGDVISVLPYSHIYEHTVIYIYLIARARYSICHDPGELLADLREVRPTGMTSVPRIFERVLSGVRGQAQTAGGVKAKLVPWALRVARRYAAAKTFERSVSPWLRLQYAVARRLVLSQNSPRARAPSRAFSQQWKRTAACRYRNDLPRHGRTDHGGVRSHGDVTGRLGHRLSANEYGTVGRPISGVEVRIAEDGEVLVRGRNVMQGYYRDPQATAAAIVDGWLHTGDIGEVDAAGFLRITDRKNEIFKTSTGK